MLANGSAPHFVQLTPIARLPASPPQRGAGQQYQQHRRQLAPAATHTQNPSPRNRRPRPEGTKRRGKKAALLTAVSSADPAHAVHPAAVPAESGGHPPHLRDRQKTPTWGPSPIPVRAAPGRISSPPARRGWRRGSCRRREAPLAPRTRPRRPPDWRSTQRDRLPRAPPSSSPPHTWPHAAPVARTPARRRPRRRCLRRQGPARPGSAGLPYLCSHGAKESPYEEPGKLQGEPGVRLPALGLVWWSPTGRASPAQHPSTGGGA